MPGFVVHLITINGLLQKFVGAAGSNGCDVVFV